MYNKKASLEISIQAIVIVVLAMTLLGLGLGFIRGMFKNIGGVTEEVSAQVKQRIIDELLTSDSKLTFSTTEITLRRGEERTINIGIRNKLELDFDYKIDISPISRVTKTTVSDLTSTSLTTWFQFDNAQKRLAASDIEVRNIKIKPEPLIIGGESAGSYLVVVSIKASGLGLPNDIYASKELFINVI